MPEDSQNMRGVVACQTAGTHGTHRDSSGRPAIQRVENQIVSRYSSDAIRLANGDVTLEELKDPDSE